MGKMLYYDPNKHQLTIGDCASGDLQPVIVEPTLTNDTFQISDEGRLQIKIGSEYSELFGPSLIGPSGEKGEKGEKGDSSQIEIRNSDYDGKIVRHLYVNDTELTDETGDGVGLITDDDVVALHELIEAAQTPATTSLDDPLADLSEVVQQQAQQIEELQVLLAEASARLTALETDTAWLKELNKEEMLQYWGVKTTTEE